MGKHFNAAMADLSQHRRNSITSLSYVTAALYNADMKSFAEHLVRLRRGKGMTRYRLAKLSGVTEPAIRKLETGSDPKLSTLMKLSRALDVTICDLLAFSKPSRK
jgi:DNA-binding phage protein